MANKKENMIQIKLVKSLIGSSEHQRRVVKGLGLSKKDQVVEHMPSVTILGMVKKVPHIVQIID